MKLLLAILTLLMVGCHPVVTVTSLEPEWTRHVLRYYYESETYLPPRVVYILKEDIDSVVVFVNTPQKFQTTVVVPDRELTFDQKDQMMKKALDYVLKDIR